MSKHVPLDELGRKFCRKCETYKPLSDYHPNKGKSHGVQAYCKICWNKQVYEKYDATQFRAWHLKRTYGISPEEYAALLAKQQGVCAACKQPAIGRPGRTKRTNNSEAFLHVDHDHSTGEVRGLLCHECNTALGSLDDNPERIKALLAYVENFNLAFR